MGVRVSKEDTANVVTKQAIQAACGGTIALAMAMLEDKHLEAQPHGDYPFGDKYPNGTPKLDDAACFGVFKMNWYMIQQCPSSQRIIGNRPASFVWRTVGTRINGDPRLATDILMEAMQKWSTAPPNPAAPVAGNFWAGHRWGQDGLTNKRTTNWKDIWAYYDDVLAIKAKCDKDSAVWTTRTRYWVLLKSV
jgi:hypothetical protein